MACLYSETLGFQVDTGIKFILLDALSSLHSTHHTLSNAEVEIYGMAKHCPPPTGLTLLIVLTESYTAYTA